MPYAHVDELCGTMAVLRQMLLCGAEWRFIIIYLRTNHKTDIISNSLMSL